MSTEILREKISKFEIKKGWQWLFYINLLLPAILYAIAYFMAGSSLGITFATLFHTYSLYIINPVPHMESLTGLIGLIIPVYFAIKAAQAKDYKDLSAVIIILVLTWAFFITECNYIIINFLSFK